MTAWSTILYENEREFPVMLGNEPIVLVTKPGLPDWNRISPSTELLVVHTEINPGDKVLLIGCHQAALPVHLAQHLSPGNLWATDHDAIALDMASKTIAKNPVTAPHFLTDIEVPKNLYQNFDIVLFQSPKGRWLARRWLLQAYLSLADQGRLYIAGANSSGIQSIIKDAAQLFGEADILGYKKGHRIAQFIRRSTNHTPPDWVLAPGIAPGTWVEFSASIADHTVNLRSLPGVFSFDQLDEGTKMLLETVEIQTGSRVLDAGCGYGVIGIFAWLLGAKLVHFVDSNLLAIAACKASLSLNMVEGAQVFAGDLLTPVKGKRYDLVLTNPPFHAGQKVEYASTNALIEQSYQALTSSGRLILVSNKFIRYDVQIKEIFGNVTYLAASNKYHVLSGLKSN